MGEGTATGRRGERSRRSRIEDQRTDIFLARSELLAARLFRREAPYAELIQGMDTLADMLWFAAFDRRMIQERIAQGEEGWTDRKVLEFQDQLRALGYDM